MGPEWQDTITMPFSSRSSYTLIGSSPHLLSSAQLMPIFLSCVVVSSSLPAATRKGSSHLPIEPLQLVVQVQLSRTSRWGLDF